MFVGKNKTSQGSKRLVTEYVKKHSTYTFVQINKSVYQRPRLSFFRHCAGNVFLFVFWFLFHIVVIFKCVLQYSLLLT